MSRQKKSDPLAAALAQARALGIDPIECLSAAIEAHLAKTAATASRAKIEPFPGDKVILDHPDRVRIVFQAPRVMADMLPLVAKLDRKNLNSWILESLDMAIKGCLEQSAQDFKEDAAGEGAGVPHELLGCVIGSTVVQ